MRRLCLIGVSAAGGGRKRIAVAAAAAAERHVLTLLQGVKAAALHVGRGVGAPVLAGVVIATKASASIAEAGAAVIFKNCFILFFPFWFKSERSGWDAGSVSAIDTRRKQRISRFLPWPLPAIEMHRVVGRLKYDHHSNWRHDSHADDLPCLNRPQRGSATRRAYASSDKLRVILPHQVVLPTPLKGRIARTRWPDPVGVRDAG
jgi:hypothetical protein